MKRARKLTANAAKVHHVIEIAKALDTILADGNKSETFYKDLHARFEREGDALIDELERTITGSISDALTEELHFIEREPTIDFRKVRRLHELLGRAIDIFEPAYAARVRGAS